MNYLEITKVEEDSVSGVLMNESKSLKIPVTLKGSGLGHFHRNMANEKVININPDMINVFKNDNLLYSMMNVKLSDMLGKHTIEGVNAKDWHSPIVLSVDDIKSMWIDSYDSKFHNWNISV